MDIQGNALETNPCLVARGRRGAFTAGGLRRCGEARRREGNVLLHDENNYTTTASLSIPTVETTAGADADICWSNVVDDLQCHPVSSTADLDNVSLLRVAHLSH